MKKFFILATCLIAFVCAHAQPIFTHTFTSGHVHVTITDTLAHDSTYCQSICTPGCVITIDSSYVGDSIRIVDSTYGYLVGSSPFVNTAGTSPWTIYTVIGGGGYDDAWVPAGGGYLHFYYNPMKITTPLDTVHLNYFDSLWVLPCLYGTVSGKIYIDNNANCIRDAGDTFLNEFISPKVNDYLTSPPGIINYEGIGTDIFYGSYVLNIQKSWMTSYTVSFPPAYAFIFPMSPCFTGPYTFTTFPQTNVDFPMLCSSNVDVHCGELSPPRVRWHTPFYMHPYVSNTGCDTMSGTMTLVKDHRVIYNATLSTNPADIVHGDTLIWNYAHLSSLSSGAYWNSFMSDVYLDQDTTVVPGDTLCFRVYTNIPPADVNIYNNDYTVCVPVVYSFDPNSKEMMPAGTGTDEHLPPNTNELTYTINFQNTGSDYAYDVKIIDTLDSHLDPHTLKILGTSHQMDPKWLASNIVEFDYNSIMLPDSTLNEPQSHGQVRYSIKLRSGLPVGTPVKNTAYIYFDANPPVVTNTTYGITSLPSATPQVKVPQHIKVYPNPANDVLNIENAAASNLYILNISGTVIEQQYLATDNATIDISRLAPGVYILKTVNDTKTATIKFSKY